MRPLVLAALLVTAASAQPSNWELPGPGASVTLAADRPYFNEGNPFEGVTSAWSLSARVPVGPGLRVVGEVPFAFANTRNTSETASALGNVQVGAEADLAAAPVTLGGYVRLPTASVSPDDGSAQVVGLFAEFEQIGTYLVDVATVAALTEGRIAVRPTSPLTVRLRVIPQVLIPTGDRNALFTVGDPEVYVVLAGHMIYDADEVLVSGGLTSLTLLTDDGSDSTNAFAGVSADVAVGHVRPGLTLRAPLSDSYLNSVVGLRLSVGL